MTSMTSMTSIPIPKSRIATRIILPLAIVGGALAILAWSSWRAWAPLTVVHAVPVVVRPVELAAGAPSPSSDSPAKVRAVGPIVQAPGWIEPSPFPISVAALTAGVVREVFVLEGDHVTKDQVVAQLVNEERLLALRKASAEVDIKASERDGLRDELTRKSKLVASGGFSEGEVTRLGHRVRGAEAAFEFASAVRDEATLALTRTEIRSPIAGVVMTRLVAPGTLVGMDASTSTILQLFDPTQLQVRTDVPLSDAGRLVIGQSAVIQVDALPGTIIRGRIIRVVQQADIAKNTLQVKVLLENPPAGLVPDMLARVKIETGAKSVGAASAGANANSDRTEVAALETALRSTVPTADGSRAGEVRVVVDVRDGVGRIEVREVLCAAGPDPDGWTAVYQGLRPGDLVVLDDSPPTKNGQSVRISERAVGITKSGGHDGHN